jgi:cytidylate kinase
MPGVTISAGYGAGGSVIAPAVAERLGVPYLDRAISARVAAQLKVSVKEAEGGAVNRSLVDRVLAALAPLSDGSMGTAGPDPVAEGREEAERFRTQSEAIMREALAGGAVILGRAGAAALRGEPGVLRVRLFGPVAARIAQAARIEAVDEETARKRQPEVDRARAHYVRRLYGVDIDDPIFFHIQLDSTRLSFDACANLIADAYRSLIAGPAAVAASAGTPAPSAG